MLSHSGGALQAIEAQVRRYWEVLAAAPRVEQITQVLYTELHIRISKVLSPEFHIEAARQLAAEDWGLDKQRLPGGVVPADRMSWGEFAGSMFELVELWTEASPEDNGAAGEHIAFLKGLFAKITMVVVDGGGEVVSTGLRGIAPLDFGAAPADDSGAASPAYALSPIEEVLCICGGESGRPVLDGVRMADPVGALAEQQAVEAAERAAAAARRAKAKLRAAAKLIPRPPVRVCVSTQGGLLRTACVP